MLDLKLVRDDPEGVKAALAKRGPGAAGLVDRLLEADATRRRLVTEVDALRATQKRRGREVARAAPDQRQQVLTGLKELSDRLAEAEASLRAAEAELAELQGRMPNLPDPATPAGGEEDSVELRRVGTPGVFDFEVRDHLELGELLGAIDTVRAAKVSGARFGYLTGPGALLELALVRFVMDRLTAAGFAPMIPPVLVRREAMFGTGFLPTDEQQIFRTAGDLGGSAARKFDCEAWIPSQGTYRELTSTSNCTDYQARRIGCRVREPDGNRPPHTLNGTAVAVGRTIVALLENHQQV